MELFVNNHSWDLETFNEDLQMTDHIPPEHILPYLLYKSYKSQESLNKITLVLIGLTLVLVIFTAFLIYFTVQLL
jgi:hypothetical protein